MRRVRFGNHGVIPGAYVDIDQLLALRHLPSPATLSKANVVGHRAGNKLSNIKGRGVDFAEVRAYQPGDDIRSIDWRVTARKNKPHTKVFREERERPTLVVVDQSQSMFFGSKLRLKSVAAAEVAARCAWQTLAVGDRVGGVVIGNKDQRLHRPFRTSKSVARFLNDIAQYNLALHRPALHHKDAHHSESLNQGMLQVRRLTNSNYRIIIISDFSSSLEKWTEHLHQLARRNQVVVIHIHDPIEEHLPPANDYVVTDGTNRLQFFTGDKTLRQRYQTRFRQHCQAIQELCAHDSMRYLNISTSDDTLDSLAWT
ncbi:MAG: DUF58 domain-containing protein [Gammaproteobacteria bacterium]|nr:DUF58 domain-containing protein [Gammaproteobacteria bacterium]